MPTALVITCSCGGTGLHFVEHLKLPPTVGREVAMLVQANQHITHKNKPQPEQGANQTHLHDCPPGQKHLALWIRGVLCLNEHAADLACTQIHKQFVSMFTNKHPASGEQAKEEFI
eukprot:1161745-Pelagomonas_calceolata.AAC.16